MFTFKRGVIAALLILALGNGIALFGMERTSHAECIDRNRRAQATTAVLAKLIGASRADGDSHAAAVWADFQRQAAKAPVPKC